MAKPPLSMKPTGWFQVAWSAEIEVATVRRMHYFGRELVAWRGESGAVTVMDAYCEHLGAHLGYGGTVLGDRIQCPFHGWEWNAAGRNVCIPYEPRPNLGRKITTYPVAERNEAVYIWHDAEGGEPYFDVPDVFTSWDDGARAAGYHPAYPGSLLLREGLELHPQYVLENGVDFAHFKYVHKVPIVPIFTRHDFGGPVSYVDFTISFDGSAASADEIDSGVHAINAGLGLAVTKSWGMLDNRTATAVTPVDDSTCDVRFSVWIGRQPGVSEEESGAIARRQSQGVVDQFLADVEIWSHQRYADPAALARGEYAGFTALREWARQFYPETLATPAR
ncbi:Rieske (2Fe-2S) protein [Amycolatopsis acidicola]|uniref:Rieske-type oxygenase n=1 Tax=Amycolatopsis acidicola TaxID=2596893 RepID=A0A5N0UUZ0_9PSEU|nr:Rieske 2Fe-2S domain-containing protein [Amycolatopsis acidicola]KAA9156555.1 Rieske (2Fe-2S) protein [Amycolatopsis acidicola]